MRSEFFLVRSWIPRGTSTARPRTHRAADPDQSGQRDLAHGEGALRFRQFHAPHLLEVVETSHIGPEQMDDDVAAVDQEPVAGGGTLDPDLGDAGMLELHLEMF